jgi:hypothetical protein
MQQTFNPVIRTSKLEEKPTSVALFLYVQATYGWLSRMLAKHNIKYVGLHLRRSPVSFVL